MAEAETATAVQEDQYIYNVKVEDAGPATKKVIVEIPEQRIQEALDRHYRDLKREATVPGFRAGRAPRKLIERRFRAAIREDVRRELVSESYQQALEKNNLRPIGEPEFDNPDAIQLPDSGALNYTFSVEVQPDFQLPDMANLTVRKPKITVTDANVDQAMANLREQQGTLVPVEDRGIEEKDYFVADVHVKLDGEVVAHHHDAQLVARPGRLAGIQIDDLAEKVRGARGGETRTFTVHAAASHPDERIRDRDVEVEIAVKDIKKLEPVEVNEGFLSSLGFASEQELRDALREQLEARIEFDVRDAMREQVRKYLLDNVQLDLPAKLTERQTDRIVQRQAVELMMRGVPREQVEPQIEQLRAGAGDLARQELKLLFILQKVAADFNVDVEEQELNGRVATLAMQQSRRAEKLKQEMANDGTLASLYVQIREQKALDELLRRVKIEEVEPQQAQ